MGRIRQYRTALGRHHRSRGFGIHSPHAYNFVRFVLREKSPYYCYTQLKALHRAAARPQETLSELKLVFRVANYFNPTAVLQIGNSEILATAIAMVNSKMTITVAKGDPCEAIKGYSNEIVKPFVVMSHLSENVSLEPLVQKLAAMLSGEATLVVLHRDRCKPLQQLWEDLLPLLEHGQSFANHRTGIIVASPRLNREHFELWL